MKSAVDQPLINSIITKSIKEYLTHLNLGVLGENSLFQLTSPLCVRAKE